MAAPRPAAAVASAPLTPPQQTRSRATRQRLIEASLATLEEEGLARTTTTRVVARAGVSQGALFKHFATKAELLSATVEHLFAALIGDFRGAFGRLARRGDPLPGALRVLFRIFQQPRFAATLELFVAARTDRDLANSLAPVLEKHRAALLREAAQLFPGAAAENPDFDAAVELILNALQGAAVGSLPHRDRKSDARLLRSLEALARRELGMQET